MVLQHTHTQRYNATFSVVPPIVFIPHGSHTDMDAQQTHAHIKSCRVHANVMYAHVPHMFMPSPCDNTGPNIMCRTMVTQNPHANVASASVSAAQHNQRSLRSLHHSHRHATPCKLNHFTHRLTLCSHASALHKHTARRLSWQAKGGGLSHGADRRGGQQRATWPSVWRFNCLSTGDAQTAWYNRPQFGSDMQNRIEPNPETDVWLFHEYLRLCWPTDNGVHVIDHQQQQFCAPDV